MAREISHKGTVISSDPTFTEVEIIRDDACSLCHARELCSLSKQEHKIVTVATDPYNIHDVGEQVEICMKPSMGMKAVWISYILPLVLLVAVMFAFKACGFGEIVCAGAALGGVAIYYTALYFMRAKLENEFEFYIK